MKQQNPCNQCGKTLRQQAKGCDIIYCYRQHIGQERIYDIIDKDGAIMPRRYDQRPRTLKEAEAILKRLNKNGEYKPYTIVQNLRFTDCSSSDDIGV